MMVVADRLGFAVRERSWWWYGCVAGGHSAFVGCCALCCDCGVVMMHRDVRICITLVAEVLGTTTTGLIAYERLH